MNESKNQSVSQLSFEVSSIDIQAMLLERAKNVVLSTAVELTEQDMARLCGKPFSRKSDDELCHRGGSEMTSLMLDGAKYSVRRPRARKAGDEVELDSLSKTRDQDLLDKQMLSRLMKSVSTRNYSEVISGFAEKTAVSKSSVSSAFKRASQKDLDLINNADSMCRRAWSADATISFASKLTLPPIRDKNMPPPTSGIATREWPLISASLTELSIEFRMLSSLGSYDPPEYVMLPVAA